MQRLLQMKDIGVINEITGQDIESRLGASKSLCLSLGKTSYFLMFSYTDIRNELKKDEQVCFYCGDNELVFISDSSKCHEIISSVSGNNQPYIQLLEFFLLLTADDLDVLEKIEDKITELEDSLLSNKKTAVRGRIKIITIRRSLLRMKRYYEQLCLITDEFSEDLNNIIPASFQKRFISLNRRLNHLLDSIIHLREYITQVREAYQAQIDIEQNQIMKVFTVLTGIFMPLTLIVGWYGMNLQMPEFGWSFGYPYVIILSVVVCILCIIYFKFKKWF